MTSDDDFIGTLEDYLDAFDGATPLPDRVRDSIHAELPGTRQVRPVTGPMRVLTTMSETTPLARWGLVAAAIVVALALGAAYLSTNRSIAGVGASPTPVATPPPTVAPTQAVPATSLRSAPSAACDPTDTERSCLAPGDYTLPGVVWPATVSFHVPAGWFEYGTSSGFDGVLVDGGPEARTDSGWGLEFLLVGSVAKDPCDASAGTFSASDVDTPDKLAAAMAQWPGFAVSRAVPVTVGGHDARLVEVTATTAKARCGSQIIWWTPSEAGIDAYPMIGPIPNIGQPGQFRILDIGGKLMAIRTTDFAGLSPREQAGGLPDDPKRHVADQSELHAILDSIRFTTAKPGR